MQIGYAKSEQEKQKVKKCGTFCSFANVRHPGFIAWQGSLWDVVSGGCFFFPAGFQVGWWEQNQNKYYFILCLWFRDRGGQSFFSASQNFGTVLNLGLLRQLPIWLRNPGWCCLSSFYDSHQMNQNEKCIFP